MTSSVLTLALLGALSTVEASHNSKPKTYTYTSTYNYNYSGYSGYTAGSYSPSSYSGYTTPSAYSGYTNSYGGYTNSYSPSAASYSGYYNSYGGYTNSYGGYTNSYGGYTNSYSPSSVNNAYYGSYMPSKNATAGSYGGSFSNSYSGSFSGQKLDYKKPAAEYKINVGQGDQVITYKEANPVQLSNGSVLEGVRVKFMDYFFYALVGGSDVSVNDVGTCVQECGKAEWANKCCATVTMYRQSD